MTGKTHRVGGALCALAGYSLLEQKGLLIHDVSPLLQLGVMYPFAIYGSVVSDLDHHWESAPCKDILSWGINKVLHLTTKLKSKNPIINIFNAKHRSWQTHSDLFLVSILVLSDWLLTSATGAESILINLVFSGLLLGIISHMILDMLTPEGIWSVILVLIKGFLKKVLKIKIKAFPTKIHFVPKSSFFATDGPWEEIVRKMMWVLCFILLIRIVYLCLPYRFVFL